MMSLPEGSALGTLTDRELLLMVYSKVDVIAKSQTDIESRVRVLEAENNRTLGLMAATGGGSGALGGGVVAVTYETPGGVRMSLAGLLNQDRADQGADRHRPTPAIRSTRQPAHVSGPDLLQAAPGPSRPGLNGRHMPGSRSQLRPGTRTSSSSPMAWSESRSRSPESTTAPGSSTIPVSTYEQTKGELSHNGKQSSRRNL
jgi:hypothetical protein